MYFSKKKKKPKKGSIKGNRYVSRGNTEPRCVMLRRRLINETRTIRQIKARAFSISFNDYRETFLQREGIFHRRWRRSKE